MISKHKSKLVWQHIDWYYVKKYVDSLKSRIYNAFFEKYTTQIHQLQFKFVRSPLVILLALEKTIAYTILPCSIFEIGYLVFCLNNNVAFDLSFFHCYQQCYHLESNILIKDLVAQIKYIIVVWLIEIYRRYLCYRNSFFCKKFNSTSNLYVRVYNQIVYHNYAMTFDLRSYIIFLNLSGLLRKLLLNKAIVLYLYKLFDRGILGSLNTYMDLSVKYVVFRKKQSSLLCKLLNLFVLQIIYELFTMLSNCVVYKDYVKNMIFINDLYSVLVFCQTPGHLKIIKKYLLAFLSFYGNDLQKRKKVSFKSLFESVYLKRLLIAPNYQLYPFGYLIKPSLYNQFILLKQINSILGQSKTSYLFLLIIRLNKLLLLWLSSYFSYPAKKNLYLINYLISLKWRLFIKGKTYKSFNYIIRFFKTCDTGKNVNYIWKPTYKDICIYVSNGAYYRTYVLFNLLWLFRLK